MLVLRRPSDEYLRQFLLDQRSKQFSYIEVGGTYGKRSKEDCAELLAAGYDVDHYRVHSKKNCVGFNTLKRGHNTSRGA